MRQIVLDTETTGLEHSEGHRIIEIGCIEMQDRRLSSNDLHYYIDPERTIDAGAISVHGITNEDLAGKPKFADIADELVAYLTGAELIIHNAAFDIGFMDAEMAKLQPRWPGFAEICTICDTLLIARERHPGQRNSLDALCKRYEVDNSGRELHGALLDAQLLADVYLALTGGQTSMFGEDDSSNPAQTTEKQPVYHNRNHIASTIVEPTVEELTAHAQYLAMLNEKSDNGSVWQQLDA